MKFPVVVSLILVLVVLIGKVLPFSIGQSCVDCGAQRSSTMAFGNAAQVAASPDDILFTDAGVPVKLVDPAHLTSQDIVIDYASLHDASGAAVSAGTLTVVSVFEQRPMLSQAASNDTLPTSDVDQSASTAIPPTPITDREAISQSSERILIEDNDSKSHDGAAIMSKKHSVSAQPQVVQSDSGEAKASLVDTPADTVHTSSGWSDVKVVSGLAAAAIAVAASREHRNTTRFVNTSALEPAASPVAVSKFSGPVAQHVASAVPVKEPAASPTRAVVPVSLRHSKTTRRVLASDSSDSSDLADDIDDVDDDVKDLTATVDDLSDTVDDIQDSLTTVESDVSSLQTQVGEVDVVQLSTDVDDLSSQFTVLEKKTYAGIASTAALVTAIPSDPGKTIVNVGYGHYEGANAIGVSVSKRLSRINGYLYSGVATDMSDVKAPLLRAGVGIEF